MNRRNTFSVSDKIYKRRAPCCRDRGVRVIEEAAGRAVQKNRIVLLKIIRVDVLYVVADRGGPQATPFSEFFHGLGSKWNRSMHKSARSRVPDDQYFTWTLRRHTWGGRQGGDHGIHGFLTNGNGCGVSRHIESVRLTRPCSGRRRQQLAQSACHFVSCQSAAVCGVPVCKPSVEPRLDFAAGQR